jgi:hypothetical protein
MLLIDKSLNGVVCFLLNCFVQNLSLPDLYFSEPSIIHVIFLNRTLRILCALGVFCTLLPIVDYFYFYSTEITEYKIDDSGICSHYPIYQIPCGKEVSECSLLCIFSLFFADGKKFNFEMIERCSNAIAILQVLVLEFSRLHVAIAFLPFSKSNKTNFHLFFVSASEFNRIRLHSKCMLLFRQDRMLSFSSIKVSISNS